MQPAEISALAEPPISEEDKKAKKIAVVEIFGPVIQGEGPMAGSKTMFVRFGGCDYRCQKCDSLHAVLPQAVKKNATYMTAEQITDELTRLRTHSSTPWVTLSGGNPCMWDLTRLVQLLRGAGFAIAVETQGTLCPQWLQKVQMVVISPKSPGMGEKFEPDKFRNMLQMCWGNQPVMVPVAVKVVVFSALDLEFATQVEAEMNLANPPQFMSQMLYLSLGNPFPPILNEAVELEDNPGIRQGPGGTELFYHREELLACYKSLLEDFLPEGRLGTWKFLPQLHVLVYSNATGR